MKPTILILSIATFCLLLLKVVGFIYFCAISAGINLALAGWFTLAKRVHPKQVS